MNRLEKIYQPGRMTIGLEMPLDNDWSTDGDSKRKGTGRPFGVPDISRHSALAKLADQLGFAALWLRDVPVYDPAFGDAAQQFEAFTYLGYLAAITENILLGTAAIVLPLREPILVAKAAASVDRLSGGRLLLGLGLGDRAVEFPLFGRNFEDRAERFREGVYLLRHAWNQGGYLEDKYPGVGHKLQVFPSPVEQSIPLVMAGYGQQTFDWIAQNMQAWICYPRSLDATGLMLEHWQKATDLLGEQRKPLITAYHLNLAADPQATYVPHKFGSTIGRNGLKNLLSAYRTIGVAHMVLHLRHSQRPVEEVMQELSEYILPEFQPVGKYADVVVG